MNAINTRFKELKLKGKPGVKHLKRLAKTQAKRYAAIRRGWVKTYRPAELWLLMVLGGELKKRTQKKYTMRQGAPVGPKPQGVVGKIKSFFGRIFGGAK